MERSYINLSSLTTSIEFFLSVSLLTKHSRLKNKVKGPLLRKVMIARQILPVRTIGKV